MAAPANDNFANAEVLSTAGGTFTGTTVEATRELNEPTMGLGASVGPSVWFVITLTSTANYVFDTEGSAFDTVMGIYTGSAVDALTEITTSDDAIGSQSRISFSLDAGTYHIAVQGFGGATGALLFHWLTSVALTGTATASITEGDIVTGGKTIILTVTGGRWVPTGASFDAQRQNIINGIDSAQAEATGWDAVVKAGLAVTAVARTSDTVVTVTLSAFATYNITAQETITATIPSTALAGGLAVVASPTFTITADVVPGGSGKFLSLLGVG